MRWCRSCIRTRPSPRSTVRSRTTSCVLSFEDLDLDQVTVGRPGDETCVDQRLPEDPVGVRAALDLDQQGAGAVQEVAGGRGPEQPAAVEDHDVVAHPLQLTEQVGGHEHRDPELGADPAHQGQHVVARRRVQPVGRLVQQHQPGVVHDRLGQLRPLLHARGVATHRAVALLGQPDVAEHVGGALARGGVGQPRHLAHVDHEVAGRHVGRQAVVLGHVAHQRPDPAAVGDDVVTEHPSRSARGRGQPEEDLDQGRLAGAVGSDEAGDALADADVELVEGGHPWVPLRQPDGFDDHLHHVNVTGAGLDPACPTRRGSLVRALIRP